MKKHMLLVGAILLVLSALLFYKVGDVDNGNKKVDNKEYVMRNKVVYSVVGGKYIVEKYDGNGKIKIRTWGNSKKEANKNLDRIEKKITPKVRRVKKPEVDVQSRNALSEKDTYSKVGDLLDKTLNLHLGEEKIVILGKINGLGWKEERENMFNKQLGNIDLILDISYDKTGEKLEHIEVGVYSADVSMLHVMFAQSDMMLKSLKLNEGEFVDINNKKMDEYKKFALYKSGK